MKELFKPPSLRGCYFSFFLLFFSISPPLLFAQAGQGGNAYLKKIEKRYGGVQSFRAKFIQTSKAPGVVRREKASGIVYLRKDGKFRWDYDEPEVVLIISDGNTLWIYQPEDKQVMVDRTFKTKMKRFPYTFLKGMEHLGMDFNAHVLNRRGEEVTLKLIPKKPIKKITKMQITFNTHSLLIRGITWTSAQGVETLITFNDIDITSKIPDSVFHFEPPEGVDIVSANAP